MPQDSDDARVRGPNRRRPARVPARGICVAALRVVRAAVLAATFFGLAACSQATLGQPDSGANSSPGTVTLHLALASTTSFCDPPEVACSPSHIGITTLAGQALQVVTGTCPLICSSQCVPPPCADGQCPPSGQAVTEATLTWDGSYYESSTCGQGWGCWMRKFVGPGRYFAHMCATPGMLGQGDGGWPTCTATGQQECVDTPFDFPGPSTVEATLP